MVIVDPDQIAILNIFGNSLCKQAVRLFIRIPREFVKGNLAGMIVEQRPEDRIYAEHRTLVKKTTEI